MSSTNELHLPLFSMRKYIFHFKQWLESNQGNQCSSGNQKNITQGQRPDMENRHTQQRTQSN